MYDWFHYIDGKAEPAYDGSAKALRVGGNGDIHALCGKRAAILVMKDTGEVVQKTGQINSEM